MVETLDYIIFIFFLKYINQIYNISFTNGAIIFASSYFARIIGSVLISLSLRKRANIKLMFSTTMLIIGLTSFLIALTPFIYYGIYILPFLRFIQGAGYTLELPVSLYNLLAFDGYRSIRHIFIYGCLGFVISLMLITFLESVLYLNMKMTFVIVFLILSVISFISYIVRKRYNQSFDVIFHTTPLSIDKIKLSVLLFLLSFATNILFMNTIISYENHKITYMLVYTFLMMVVCKIKVSKSYILAAIFLLPTYLFTVYANVFTVLHLAIIAYLVTCLPTIINMLYTRGASLTYTVLSYNCGIGCAALFIAAHLYAEKYIILLLSIVSLTVFIIYIRKYNDYI